MVKRWTSDVLYMTDYTRVSGDARTCSSWRARAPWPSVTACPLLLVLLIRSQHVTELSQDTSTHRRERYRGTRYSVARRQASSHADTLINLHHARPAQGVCSEEDCPSDSG